MKSPLRVGATAAPKSQFPIKSSRPESGKARRFARLSAAAAMVLGVGAASAIFVDYLADRALARAADVPAVVVAEAVEAPAGTKVAALASEPAPVPAIAASQPVEPPKVEIAAAPPDPVAVAKVAVGPEHAIELPTDDPTASPIVLTDEVSASEDALPPDESVLNEERLAAYAEDDADGTQTAAIAPDAAEPDEPLVKKPKRQKAEAVKPQSIDKKIEVASLPGVNVGGLAGHTSDEDNVGSTVKTVTKKATTAAKNLGGVAPGTARVSAAVNMRSSPKKGSGVLLVVPAGSAVNVLSCDGWCQIVYNGKKGWVYKNYLTGSKVKPQKQQAARSAAPAADPTASKAPSSRL
ncbi:SH3 domain-containing protein [Mesorhizobium sp. KR9-304]|uniref:SH3 domain-containing protein n=1 Tax=Mesorhizobium sp. KR9-304 TaxID=3156614 RepID=UPI0032B455CF